MRLDFGGPPVRFPFLASIGKMTDVFLFLRVHGDHRLPLALQCFDLFVDALKLCLSVRMIGPFLCFAVRLQAIAQRIEQPVDRPLTDPMPLGG